MKCEFEEDTFQQAVDVEIGRMTRYMTTPGRVSEAILGYDAAFYLDDPGFWGCVPGMLMPSSGVLIDGPLFDRFDELTSVPPKFKCNLFLQYKVPEKLLRKGKEWGSWGKQYFRYDLRQKQLNILKLLSDRAAGDALVAYASPAFVDSETLVRCSLNGSIFQKTNFVRAADLHGHHRYTYVDGTRGVAHSEPESVQSFDLPSYFAGLSDRAEGYSYADNVQRVSELIMASMDGTPVLNLLKPADDEPIQRAHSVIRRFEYLAGVRFYMLG